MVAQKGVRSSMKVTWANLSSAAGPRFFVRLPYVSSRVSGSKWLLKGCGNYEAVLTLTNASPCVDQSVWNVKGVDCFCSLLGVERRACQRNGWLAQKEIMAPRSSPLPHEICSGKV